MKTKPVPLFPGVRCIVEWTRSMLVLRIYNCPSSPRAALAYSEEIEAAICNRFEIEAQHVNALLDCTRHGLCLTISISGFSPDNHPLGSASIFDPLKTEIFNALKAEGFKEAK